MASRFAERYSSDVPLEKVARVFMTTLRRLQWNVTFVDEETGVITGERKVPETVMGKVWHYNFSVVIRWVDEEGLAGVEIEVNELAYDWTEEDCKKRLVDLQRGLYEDSRLIVSMRERPKKGARWATPNELVKAGYISNKREPGRLIVTGDGDNFMSLPEGETNRHALVCGPTGTGKTTGIFIPNLVERVTCSAIVTEATGGKGVADLFTKTVGYRASKGHRIIYFNPDDLTSDQINPLDLVETYKDARRVVEIIMQSTTLDTHKGDQSWEMSERMLLTGLILHSVGLREEGKANLAYICDLFEDGPEGMQSQLADSPIEAARKAYKKFMNTTTPPYRNLVANGLITRLDLWNQPRIRKLTERTSVDYDLLTDELFTWYLATPADKPELKPLAALVFNLALDLVMNRKFKHPVGLFLDELTNFGYVRGLPAKLTIIRHDKIPAILGVQDFVQLENLYRNEAKLLISQPALKAFFKPNDPDTAKKISDMLGTAVDEEGKVTSTGHIKEAKDKEPLLTVDDLLNLGAIDESKSEAEGGKPNMIVFLPGTRPVQVRALSWQNYHAETNPVLYPPPWRKPLEVDERLVRSKPKAADSSSKQAQENEAMSHELGSDEEANEDASESSGNEDEADESKFGFMQW
ncbi:MAG: type IV secretory system conjugative DNA transfer family protein [Candidatus Obscuribacterales bacterium]